MIYITGDTHGDFSKIHDFCKKMNTTTDDIMIVLGDAGINYSTYDNDLNKKRFIQRKIPITMFCIHGNHEKRPNTIKQYKIDRFMGADVYVEDESPNIKFAIDGEVYYLHGIKTMVCGGAYSVDKFYRLKMGYSWFPDEQPSEEIKQKVIDNLEKEKWDVDAFLSHTCPYDVRPVDTFLKSINQDLVDNSTEDFLQNIYNKLKFKKWYCGHYHINRRNNKFQFLFDDIRNFNVY